MGRETAGGGNQQRRQAVFPLVPHFLNAIKFIDSLLAEYMGIGESDKAKFSRELAEILDTVNYLHPFREGNGRTQREFLCLLAREKGWKLSLNPPDNAEVYERYIAGTINGDIEMLDKLIFECLSEAVG